MKRDERKARAVELVVESQRLADPRDPFVRSEVEVFDGVLVTVTFTLGRENRPADNFVFFNSADESHHFTNPADLARYLSNKNHTTVQRVTMYRLVYEIFAVGGVAGIIAIVITGGIVYLALVKQSDQLQQVLGQALLLILGFYFGKTTAKDGSPPAGTTSSQRSRR